MASFTLLALRSDYGSRPYATVLIGGRPVQIPLRQDRVCRVGDRIIVTRQKMIVGFRHRAGALGCSPIGTS